MHKHFAQNLWSKFKYRMSINSLFFR